jgi:AcrR family transcriptional regulator
MVSPLIRWRDKGTLIDMEHEMEGSGEGSWAQEETRRLMELVRFLARTLGFNNSALARRANVPLATLVRYFKGEGEPKLEFLLSLVQTMGLEVREFFELAYPDLAGQTPARAKIEKILKQIQPGRLMEAPPPRPKPEPKPETPLQREDIERMLDELRRDVREIVEGRAVDAPTKPGRARKR